MFICHQAEAESDRNFYQNYTFKHFCRIDIGNWNENIFNDNFIFNIDICFLPCLHFYTS